MNETTNPRYTIDDVVDLLKQQLDVSKVASTMAAAKQSLTAGAVSAFDRPTAVTLVGPKPLPVQFVGGNAVGAGSANAVKTATANLPGAREEEGGSILGRLWKNSRFGRATESGAGSVGRMLGGTGAKGLGGLTGSAASLAKFAGPVGMAVGAVVSLAGAANDARKAVIRMTDEQLASARRLAEVSGTMAAIFAVDDIKNLMRDQRTANATAGSTKQLADAAQRRKDASENLENAFTNGKNEILAVLNDGMVPMLELLGDAAKLALDSDVFRAAGELAKLAAGRDEKKKAADGMAAFGLAADMGRVEREAARIEADAARMMAAARAAAGGRVFPAGGRAAP